MKDFFEIKTSGIDPIAEIQKFCPSHHDVPVDYAIWDKAIHTMSPVARDHGFDKHLFINTSRHASLLAQQARDVFDLQSVREPSDHREPSPKPPLPLQICDSTIRHFRIQYP